MTHENAYFGLQGTLKWAKVFYFLTKFRTLRAARPYIHHRRWWISSLNEDITHGYHLEQILSSWVHYSRSYGPMSDSDQKGREPHIGRVLNTVSSGKHVRKIDEIFIKF
jgi:hypothetical protein